MPAKATTYVTIDATGLHVEKQNEYKKACASLPHGYYKWTLEKVYRDKTLKQLGANFAVLYDAVKPIIEDATGEVIPITCRNDDEPSVHNILKAKCLPGGYVERLKEDWKQKRVVDTATGDIIFEPVFRLTISKMTTVEMSEYWNNIRNWIMDMFGAELPEIKK